MRFKRDSLHNVFRDRSSMVLRLLLSDPARRWRINELAAGGVSVGHVVNVIDALAKRDWIERGTGWRNSFVQLTKPSDLLDAWTGAYHFDWNWTAWYRTDKTRLFSDILSFLEKRKVRFALTLFSASTLVAPYVVNAGDNLYMDADPKEGEEVLQALEGHFMLPYPSEGGNIGISLPIYRTSIFKTLQTVNKLPLVSNLQMFLDLYNFPRAGRDQAHWLAERLDALGTLPFASAPPTARSKTP